MADEQQQAMLLNIFCEEIGYVASRSDARLCLYLADWQLDDAIAMWRKRAQQEARRPAFFMPSSAAPSSTAGVAPFVRSYYKLFT